jgi:hypothetical protein
VAKSKKWMSKAFSNSHGQFKAKAERAGMSTKAFADKALGANSKASTKTKRQAALAERGMEANHTKSRGTRWYGKKD